MDSSTSVNQLNRINPGADNCRTELQNDEWIATQEAMPLLIELVFQHFKFFSSHGPMAKCRFFVASMVFDTTQSLNLLHF